MSNVLTNNTGTSIILTLNNVNSPDANIISMAPDESLLYDDVVILDTTNPNYNSELIQSYIDSGILLNQEITGITKSELQLLFQGNLTINLNTGIPQLKANPVVSGIDNIQLLPANSYGRTSYVYYKSIQGMSFSTDFGVSQVLINNDNLKHPDEITSFAVQVYDSNDGVLKEVNRLFIGTLREGVKTFTPGKDLTYVDFEPDASISGAPLFKNSLTAILITKNENGVEYAVNGTGSINGVPNVSTVDVNTRKNANGVYYPVSPQSTYSFTGYCATFVLAVINNPTNSGCPILIASRSKHFDVTTTTVINSVTGAVTDPVINTNDNYETKLTLKYLHNYIYRNNEKVDTISPIDPIAFATDNRWVLIQENTTLQSVSHIINTGITQFPQHIVDVITEYTPDGAIFMIKHPLVGMENTNSLYRIVCSPNISTIPVVSYIGHPTQLYDFPFYGKINSISYVKDIASSNYFVFVTQNEVVWQYSPVRDALTNNNGWVQFIKAANPITYLSTSISSNGILNTAGPLHLKELSKFIIIPKNDTNNAYTGLLSCESGLVIYNFRLVNNEFTPGAKSTRTLLQNVAKSIITDLQVNIYGQNIHVLSCSYSSQIPRTYYQDKNCLQLINDNSNLVKGVYYIKSDADHSSIYYVTENSSNINYTQSGEQLTYNPVLLKSAYAYNIVSPAYEYKVSNFDYDEKLVQSLNTFVPYRYYFPYIKERIISSISPAERDILTLNDFKHPILMPWLNEVSGSSSRTGVDLGTPIEISNQTTVVLQNTYAKKQAGPTTFDYTAFVCIDLQGNVVLPVNDLFSDTKQTISSTFTTLKFSSPFSGRIYKTFTSNDPEPHTISGLFKLIDHGMNCFPQVILDSLDPSLWGKLNDIRYVDQNRLEISFTSIVNTTINLLGRP
ncbi:MAG: hypothetical protein JHC33_05070 [Ignisphaera sp.]|nr:hypothetical protein [Ignisphaera sp.]